MDQVHLPKAMALETRPVERHKTSWYLVLSFTLAVLSYYAADKLSNVAFWVALTAGLVASVLAIGNFSRVLLFLLGRRILIAVLQNSVGDSRCYAGSHMHRDYTWGGESMEREPMQVTSWLDPREKVPAVELAPDIGRILDTKQRPI